MAKQVYRLPPCPAWQTDTMERWLEDMAAEGLILSRDGFMLGVGIFDQGNPTRMRFRLEPAELPVGMLADGEPEKVAFHTDLGWNYHDTRGQYHIYSTADPELPDLHTDPEVQAYAIEKTRKRLKNNFWTEIFWLILLPILRRGTFFLSTMLLFGTPFVLSFAVAWFTPLITGARELFYLRRKIKQLENNERPKEITERNWKKRSLGWIIRRVLYVFCVVFAIVIFMQQLEPFDDRRIQLADFDGELPFPTMVQMSGGYGFIQGTSFGTLNTVMVKTDILAPKIIVFEQNGDAGSLSGILEVNYFELRFPFMAKLMAWEFGGYANSRSNEPFNYFNRADTVNLPNLGLDYAKAYSDHGYCVVLAEGNKVMCINFNPYYDNKVPLEEWVIPFADALKTE